MKNNKTTPLTSEYVRHELRNWRALQNILLVSSVVLLSGAIFCETMMPWTKPMWLLVMITALQCLFGALVCLSRCKSLSEAEAIMRQLKSVGGESNSSSGDRTSS